MTELYEPASRPRDVSGDRISWEPSLAFLKFAIGALLTGAAASYVALRIFAPDQPVRAVGPILTSLVALAGWFFLARGRVQVAVRVLSIGTWLAVAGIALLTGGVRAPIVIAYPAIIIMIGWVIGSRAALAVAALTGVTIIGFVVADASGLLPKPPPDLPVLHGIVQVIVLVVSTTLVVLLARSYQNRLNELRTAGSDLARRSAELETSRADLHRAQAVAKVGSWVFDFASGRTHLSAETCRILGLPEGTPGSRKAYLARVHADDRDAVDRAWQEALGGGVFDHEHRIVAGDSIRWVRQVAELERAADGTPLRAVGVAQDITQRKAAEEAINYLAYYDPLTKLPNRRLLMDRLNHAVASCCRNKRGAALFFIDLDNFKILNDTCGHHIGDLLLEQVGRRLSTCVRQVDTVARLGGDEFVVVLTDLSPEPVEAEAQAKAVGEKVLAVLGQPYALAEHTHFTTSSIGITLFGPRQVSVNELLKQADIAMYQAKAAGRNTLSCFEPDAPGVAETQRVKGERPYRGADA